MFGLESFVKEEIPAGQLMLRSAQHAVDCSVAERMEIVSQCNEKISAFETEMNKIKEKQPAFWSDEEADEYVRISTLAERYDSVKIGMQLPEEVFAEARREFREQQEICLQNP